MPNIVNGRSVETLDIATDVTEILAEVEYIEHHVHGSNYVYGLTGSAPVLLTRPSTVPVRVTGGTDAFGTAVLLDKGAGTIGGTYYDAGKVQVVAVETANIPTIIRFYSATAGGAVAYTGEADDDVITASGHGLSDGDRLIFDTINNDTYGISRSIVYFARDVSGTTFKVELTSGGGAVNITTDISGNLKKLTPTFQTECMISMAATNADAAPITFSCPKIDSTNMLYCEARSHGASKYVDFFLDIHTYT